MKRYARIDTGKGGSKPERFTIRITRETERFITGVQVNKQGDEVTRAGVHEIVRIVERNAIEKLTPMYMNNTYGMLTDEQPRGARICGINHHRELHAPAVWQALRWVGVQPVPAGPDPIAEPAYTIELRDCPHCGSTIAKEIKP